MTEAANQILTAFALLPPEDQREVAAAVLRQTLDKASGDIPDDALVSAADHLFQELDARESSDEETETR